MRIDLITPAPTDSKTGNRTTARRWAGILTRLGHRVRISQQMQTGPVDLMIALHAWRSAETIQTFSARYPHKPLIVALTGTDAYKFMHTHAETTLQSIRIATYLVGLHALIGNTIPADQRSKLSIIYQSAKPGLIRQPVKRSFRICIAGHLREEKDPLRPAYASRCAPESSRLQIIHYGKAHTPDWAQLARQEMTMNRRYHWAGEISHSQLRKAFSSSHLLVLPSHMEGGANVISEAVMAGLPVIASYIEGSIGLLGEDYPGYYPVADSSALLEKLLLAETDHNFYKALENACAAKQPLFTVAQETHSWQQLLQQL